MEVLARLEAERRLKEAEESLHRLEKDVMRPDSDQRDADEIREEMIGDVKTLKSKIIFLSYLEFLLYIILFCLLQLMSKRYNEQYFDGMVMMKMSTLFIFSFMIMEQHAHCSLMIGF